MAPPEDQAGVEGWSTLQRRRNPEVWCQIHQGGLQALPCGGAEKVEAHIHPWGKEGVPKAQKYAVCIPLGSRAQAWRPEQNWLTLVHPV